MATRQSPADHPEGMLTRVPISFLVLSYRAALAFTAQMERIDAALRRTKEETMADRIRMMRGTEYVTVIERKHDHRRNPTIIIRNSCGFREEVRANDLTPIDSADPAASFTVTEE